MFSDTDVRWPVSCWTWTISNRSTTATVTAAATTRLLLSLTAWSNRSAPVTMCFDTEAKSFWSCCRRPMPRVLNSVPKDAG